MPTITAGTTASVYCPLAGTIAVTPGTSGRVSFQSRSVSGGQSSVPRELYAAETIAIAAGDTVTIEAINTDATYTEPAGRDGALQSLVLGAWEQVRATPGVDCIAAVNSALASLKARGGGTLHMPFIGGVGYYISDRILVDFSNCLIWLEDDLTNTATTVRTTAGVPNLFDGTIIFRGTASVYLDKVGLCAPRRVRIDCGGRNITGYTHDAFAGGQYGGVQFTFCKNIVCQNVYVYNPLTFGIHTTYALGGQIADCDVSDNLYDNGIQAGFNGETATTFSDTDPATWSNIYILNCRAWNCKNHGIGSYGAVGVVVLNPKVWNCGNNSGVAQSGPAGGINVETDGTNLTRNYRFTAVNISVEGSFGFGFRTNCLGTRVYGGRIKNIKLPTAYSADPSYPVWGSGAFIQGGATDCELLDVDIDGVCVGVSAAGASGSGIQMNNASTLYPGLTYRGKITNCRTRAVNGFGVGSVTISPESEFSANGDPTASAYAAAGPYNWTIMLQNSVANINGGDVKIGGKFDSNYGGVANTLSVGIVDVSDIRGRNNNISYSSAYHAIYIDTVATELRAANILLTSSNSLQSRVMKSNGTIAKAVLSRESIIGDQTSTTAPRADIAATVMIADVYATAAPGTAPSYFGQKWYDTTNAKMYFAKGQASSADWVILN